MANKENIGNLKTKLKSIGAKASGNKKDLNERLQLWQENKLDRKLYTTKTIPAACNSDFPEINDPQWASLDKIYKKLVRCLNINEIDEWFNERLAKASKIRGRNMALNKFVRSIYVINLDKNIFIKSNCRAETKKNVLYNQMLHLKDSVGVVKQATCTCPAGTGFSAACKHIAALLFVLEQYGLTGISIEQRSCTSQLQTWHKPVTFKTTGKLSLRDILNLPPLENVEISNKKTENLKNLFINSQISSSMTLNRNFNPFGFINDHIFEASFLVDLLNKINFVDEKTISDIEKETREQGSSRLWLLHRKSRLTASNAGAIASTVKSTKMSTKLAQRIIEAKPIFTRSVNHGKVTEKTAISVYSNITGNTVEKCGLFIDKNINYIAASPDGIVNRTIVVEVKCPDRQDLNGIKYIKGNKLSETHNYYYQVQIQMHATNLKVCHFFVYTQKEYFLQEILYNKIFCDSCLLSLDKFYKEVFAEQYFLFVHGAMP